MNFSLVICTYMRPNAVVKLLQSVAKQALYPNEVLIIDGSTNTETEDILSEKPFNNLIYFKVNDSQRGLTKQRNFGIDKISKNSDIVCFLDDDTILEKNYFENLIKTYTIHSDAVAVGGYITNEVNWQQRHTKAKNDEFELDGFVRKIGQRNILRKRFGLLTDKPPGFMPTFSNGFPISYLPPSDKTYEVEYFMGCSMSFKKEVFANIYFSTYFEGYGLYEDMDFCLRASRIGKSYVNTAAKLSHYHEEAGRPNKYKYGKMVVRNGWYVWRVKYSNPSLKDRLKWNAIVLLQIFQRGFNIFTTSNRLEVLTEVTGRKIGWFSLLFNRPKIKE